MGNLPPLLPQVWTVSQTWPICVPHFLTFDPAPPMSGRDPRSETLGHSQPAEMFASWSADSGVVVVLDLLAGKRWESQGLPLWDADCSPPKCPRSSLVTE